MAEPQFGTSGKFCAQLCMLEHVAHVTNSRRRHRQKFSLESER
jgi:hypothetical protein